VASCWPTSAVLLPFTRDEMDLFNDYLMINERLQKTGKVIIFDPQDGKLPFE
jgi:hypothetical protein